MNWKMDFSRWMTILAGGLLVSTTICPPLSWASGIITTVAGTGERGFSGDGGPATQARLNRPYRVFVDAEGNLFIVDLGNHRIRKVDATTGIITTIAGTGQEGFGGDGGPATRAVFDIPLGIFVDAGGNLFVADRYNHRIRKIDLQGIITTVAGNGGEGFSGDGGPATRASLADPLDVFGDSEGNLFIADGGNYR